MSAVPTAPHSRPPSRRYRQPPYRWTEARPTLEDVFIHLMGHAETWHDRIFARRALCDAGQGIPPDDARPPSVILLMPVIQLMLFGYAINDNPHHLPTGVFVQDQGGVRTLGSGGDAQHGIFRCRRDRPQLRRAGSA